MLFFFSNIRFDLVTEIELVVLPHHPADLVVEVVLVENGEALLGGRREVAQGIVDVVVHLTLIGVKGGLVVRRQVSKMHGWGEHWIRVMIGEETTGSSEGQDVVLGHRAEPIKQHKISIGCSNSLKDLCVP